MESEFRNVNVWYFFLPQVLIWHWNLVKNVLSQFEHLCWWILTWFSKSCSDLKSIFWRCLHLKGKMFFLWKCVIQLSERMHLHLQWCDNSFCSPQNLWSSLDRGGNVGFSQFFYRENNTIRVLAGVDLGCGCLV